MADIEPTESPLEAAAGTAGADTTEAFALLADETRLAILLALWEEHEPRRDDSVPFSRLFERLDYEDRGNFSYHLEKLEGRFIEQRTERGGYALRTPGLKLVRTVIAGTGVDGARLEPTETDETCPLCGASTTVSYRDGLLIWACTECAGNAPDEVETEGALGLVQFEPAGLADRTPGELRAASTVAAQQRARGLFAGACPTCSGPVDGRLECCPDHDPEGGCDDCGLRFGVVAEFRCRVCEEFGIATPERLALFHPEVVAFYADHGVSTWVRADDVESARRVYELARDHEMELVSEAPPRVTVTAAHDGDEVSVTFDETVNVVDVRR